MDEITRVDGMPEPPIAYRQTVGEVLAMMTASLKSSPHESMRKASGQAWILALFGIVPLEMLVPTCRYFVRHAVFFPAPSEFITRAMAIADAAANKDVIDATNARLKQEQAARCVQLELKYGDMDRKKFMSIITSSAGVYSGHPRALPPPSRAMVIEAMEMARAHQTEKQEVR